MRSDSKKRKNGFDVGHLYRPDDVEVWPDNWSTVVLFQRVSTQWRQGFAGPSGLDYTALYPVMDRMDLHPAEWLDTLDDIRLMEFAALSQISENNAEA